MSSQYLNFLEDEAIYILRESAAQFERPALLISFGKDSTVLLHLAKKAFAPYPPPFLLVHIDTGYKFPEMYEARNQIASDPTLSLIIGSNKEAILVGCNPAREGLSGCCAQLKTKALLDTLCEYNITAAIGAARREEERSRAKERIFSLRNAQGQWSPEKQRPEMWGLYNGHVNSGETMRIFPIANWSELDVWRYIKREDIEVLPLYFAKQRRVIRRGAFLESVDHLPQHASPSDIQTIMCRFRTLGCISCTSAIESSAATIDEIIDELIESKRSERATRAIDFDTDGSMEIKKRAGYF